MSGQHTMTDRLFPLATFSQAITILASMGISFDRAAARAGIPHGLIGDPAALITARQYHEMAALGQRMMKDPAFGLTVSKWVRLDMVDVIGPLFATVPDVRSYLLGSQRFMPLISPCMDVRLDEEGDEARYYCLLVPGLDGRFHHADACFGVGHRLLHSVFKRPDLAPRRLELQHDGSAWRDRYLEHFGPGLELVFNAPANVAVFDRAILDIRNPGASPAAHAQMEKVALARMAALPDVETVSTQVLRLLEQEAGRRVLDLGDVAQALGMTVRTLQRRLVDEHTTFQKLRDGVRLRQAQTLLRDSNIDIPTIAATLGFSEPNTFHRAFKAWSGVSPTDFRRRHQAG